MSSDNQKIVFNKDSRYAKCIIYRDTKGIFLGLRQKINSKPQADDRFHTVKPGDRLDRLADHYFGDCKLWWIICDYNDISFPLEMKEGMVLRIPSQEQVFMEILE